jgi:hypothetical protein
MMSRSKPRPFDGAQHVATCTLDGKLMYATRGAAKTAARQAQCKGAVISVCGGYYHWTSAGRAAAEQQEQEAERG